MAYDLHDKVVLITAPRAESERQLLEPFMKLERGWF